MRPLIYSGVAVFGLVAWGVNYINHCGDKADAIYDQINARQYGVSHAKSLATYHYALLTEGMSKADVDRLLPVPGREAMSAGDFQTVAYGDGPRIAVTFKNGRLIAKAQNGL